MARGDIEFAGKPYRLASSGPVTPDGGVRPAWNVERIRFAAARISSEAQGYANWSPEEEFPWQTSNYQGGFGSHIWVDTRYFYGLGIDARDPLELKLAPQVNSQTWTAEDRGWDAFVRSVAGTSTQFLLSGRYVGYFTSPTTIATSLDSGTGLIHTAAETFQGTHDKNLTFVAVRSSGRMPQPYLTFDATSATTNWVQDAQVNVSAIGAEGVPLAASYSNNGVFTSDNAAPLTMTLDAFTAAQDALYVGGDQPFEGLRVLVNATNANATVITAKYWNGTAYTALSGVSDGTIAAGASFGQTGNVTWTLPTDWDITQVDSRTAYWVQLTWSADFDGGVSTTDIALVQRDTAEFFAKIKNTLYRIYKSARGYKLASAANGGTSATWAEVGTLSGLDNPPNMAIESLSRLFSVHESGLRALEDDGSTISDEVWPHQHDAFDTNNGYGSVNWRGNLWLTLRQGVYRIYEDNGVLIIDGRLGPQNLSGNDSPVRGRVTAMSGDDFYLYTIMQAESGNSYLLAYNERTNAWFTLNDLGAITSRKMWVSDVGGGGNPVLYFFAGTNLRWVILPRSSPNTRHDSNCRFVSSGTFFPGQFYADFPREVKSWLTAHLVGEGLDDGQTVTYGYRTNDDGGFTDLEVFDADPGDQEPFDTATASRLIEPRITLATDDTTLTPVIRVVQTRYAVRFPFKRRFSFAVDVTDKQSLRGGQRVEAVGELVTALDNAVGTSAPITLVGPNKTSYDVLPLDSRMFLLHDRTADGARKEEYVYYVECIEHQSTALGTHQRLANFTHGYLANFTHQQLTEGAAA